jgi:hypothetical protein
MTPATGTSPALTPPAGPVEACMAADAPATAVRAGLRRIVRHVLAPETVE